ncbi:MAG: ImmA/IrrE family metallo-endopeptidase [Armatimonadetes bacterium]|nr:ImmA/IrrE family metallo-endopeptidase [Armatimonadota bacterium]
MNGRGNVGVRLAEIRRQRGLSQEDVARHLGVSRPTLVAIEKDVRKVRPDELVRLAELYGRTVHDLLVGAAMPVQPSFRVTDSAAVPEASLSEAEEAFRHACEDMLRLERDFGDLPRVRREPEAYAVQGLGPRAAGADVARSERDRMGLGDGPVGDLAGVLEDRAGLLTFSVRLQEFRIAGMFGYSEVLGGCVLLNASHPSTRARWTLAHEFGHFLMDRYREDVEVLYRAGRKSEAEARADQFAAAFLMPAEGLIRRVRSVLHTRREFTLGDLCWLADLYGVSVQAMALRLETVGQLPRGSWDGLEPSGKVQRARREIGLQSGARAGIRVPDRMRRLSVAAFQAGEITESEFAALLRRSRVEARDMLDRMSRREELDDDGAGLTLDLDLSTGLELAAAARE